MAKIDNHNKAAAHLKRLVYVLSREESWTDATNGSGGHKSQRPGWEWEEKGTKVEQPSRGHQHFQHSHRDQRSQPEK